MSHLAYLGIGSNIAPERHITVGLNEISDRFEVLAISSVYRTAAVGFQGPPFLNLVAGVHVAEDVRSLHATIRQIEYAFGRDARCQKHASRTLDIDILTFADYCGSYGDVELPRDEIKCNAFVLAPFAEIAPELILPGCRAPLHALWQAYAVPGQCVQKVSFCWQGNALPLGLNR
ncbi:MAG: 2-amino-4-hydroxy-6-hydroxymethyldihydropteridine diphosphokinase [Pseudomonadota bacterium]